MSDKRRTLNEFVEELFVNFIAIVILGGPTYLIVMIISGPHDGQNHPRACFIFFGLMLAIGLIALAIRTNKKKRKQNIASKESK